MPIAWKSPTAEDVTTFMSSAVTVRVDSSGVQTQKILDVVVQRIRGACSRANTLSINESEVPPEGLQHALVLAIAILVGSNPNFQFVIKGPEGVESGFGLMVRKAEEWVKRMQDGGSCSYPTEPAPTYPQLVRSGSDDEVATTAV